MIKYLKGHAQQNNDQAKEMHLDIFFSSKTFGKASVFLKEIFPAFQLLYGTFFDLN